MGLAGPALAVGASKGDTATILSVGAAVIANLRDVVVHLSEEPERVVGVVTGRLEGVDRIAGGDTLGQARAAVAGLRAQID